VSSAAARAVTAIAGTRRAVQLYPPAHPAYGEALVELESAVLAAADGSPFVLNVHQGRLYHDSTVLPDDVPGLGQVVETLESLGLESVVFLPAFCASDAVSLTEILALRPSPELDVSAELAARGVESVAVSLLARTGEEGEGSERDVAREMNRTLVRRSVITIRRVLEKVENGDVSAVEEARSLSRDLAARLDSDMPIVLGMASGEGAPDDRPLYHAFHVMIYSLVIGYRLGLPRDGLASLGTAALLHDVGKSAFDASDPSQSERISAEHPIVGAEMLQRFAPVDVAPMLVAYEHHMNSDGSGFPERPPAYVAHPYSRTVAIADRFDNLVHPSSGGAALTPDRALVRVLRDASSKLDPFLTRLFASTLGPFPVGCVVRLSDQSVGVVTVPGVEPLTPTVRLAFDSHGLEINDPDLDDLDLAREALRIVEVIPADSLQIDVAERLL
jgi:HD-GYP domain-containing protein (c-di-GMP phosphodiesterase class II)